MITIECPHCRANLEGRSSFQEEAPLPIRCPKCGGSFILYQGGVIPHCRPGYVDQAKVTPIDQITQKEVDAFVKEGLKGIDDAAYFKKYLSSS